MGAHLALVSPHPALPARRSSQPGDASTEPFPGKPALRLIRGRQLRLQGLLPGLLRSLPTGLLPGSPLDSLSEMPPMPKIGSPRPLGDVLLASGSRFRRYRWFVLAAAAVVEIIVIWLVHQAHAAIHPLDPVGAGIVFISILAAGFGGTLVGLAAALVGVVASFLLLADFGSAESTLTAIVSAVIWCAAAAITGLVVNYLRLQVTRREDALEQALRRSVKARDQLERVMEFSPHFYQSDDPEETIRGICEAAIETFGADGVRLFALRGDSIELLAMAPASKRFRSGFVLPLADFPDIEETVTRHRPSFVRDVRTIPAEGPALELRQELGVVSAIRVPIASPTGTIGLLSLGWTHPIERPADDLLTLMLRFTDQAAIAWQNALRAQAQERADSLCGTLERVITLAPTFHISGSPEDVARAVCEAALSTFECSGAALYRLEGDRLHVLDRRPALPSLSAGRAFPLDANMPLAGALVSHTPTFIPDISSPDQAGRPWPAEVIREGGAHSVLYVPLSFEDHGPQNLLLLSWDHLREQPDPAFLVVVERFADQVALALSNASAELLHARLEASLLPPAPVDHPRFAVVTRYRTGEQRLRLGGDFVGSTPAGDSSLDFVIGDVSGHGPDAAALGATLRSAWRALVMAGTDIPETVDVLRRTLLAEKTAAAVFATIIIGRVDMEEQVVSLVNAGHPPPLLLAGGLVQSLEGEPASPLGFYDGIPWSLRQYSLPQRWSLFLYTDGLIDARVAPGSPQRYGEDRLRLRLQEWASALPDEQAIDTLMAEIENAAGRHFADDVAVLLISTKDAEDRAAARPAAGSGSR